MHKSGAKVYAKDIIITFKNKRDRDTETETERQRDTKRDRVCVNVRV